MNKFKYLVVFGLVFQLGLSNAGEIKTDNQERKVSNQMAYSEAYYEKLVKYQKMYSNKEYAQALIGFKSLLNKGRINRLEKATSEMFIGFLESKQDNHIIAADHFKNAMESGALPNNSHFTCMSNYAKELIAVGKYKQGIEILHAYYDSAFIIEDFIFPIEAVAQVKLGEYDKAIELYNKAIALSEEPQETWNHHLYLLYVTLDQKDKASEVLEKLRTINPDNKDYWKT